MHIILGIFLLKNLVKKPWIVIVFTFNLKGLGKLKGQKVGGVFQREVALTTIMPTKNDIFGNWNKFWMCRNYRLVNKKTKSNIDGMPMLRDIKILIS
jgi:hypothetical protein